MHVQDALSLTTMLQSYMHHELNTSLWETFLSRMHQPGLSFGKIREALCDYLASALETSFQKTNTKRLRSVRPFSFCAPRTPFSYADVGIGITVDRPFLLCAERDASSFEARHICAREPYRRG